MKRVIIGALVGAVIYFGWQAGMWMGGFHNDFAKYTPNQDSVMQVLHSQLGQEGLYMIPSVDPKAGKEEKEKYYHDSVGKPWAFIFYHEKFDGMNPMTMIKGFLHNLFSCLIAALIIFYGRFSKFGSRFFVAMGFAIFALLQGVFGDMNWWQFPWSFVKTQVIDLTLGWALCSAWMAWYVRPKVA
jgi:hypothetical protein